MITDLMMCKILVITTLVLTLTSMSTYVDAAESDISMKSKGGVLYPVTGDSTQEIFRTPPDITDTLRPGMLLGILPEDCKPASKEEIDEFYICNHGLFLKPAPQGGRVAYEVIEVDWANVGKMIATGVTAIVPVSLVVNVAKYTEGERAKAATGKYNDILDE